MYYPDMNSSFCYTDILKEILCERAKANSAYSLRAFARDLNIKAPNLSNILNHKKGVSSSKAIDLCERLGFSSLESVLFCDLVAVKHAKSNLKREMAKERLKLYYEKNEILSIKENVFKVIADWYHFAILELIATENFSSDVKWIASRLSITVHQVENALQRLERLELITINDGKIASTGAQLHTEGGIPSKSVRDMNTQILDKAKIAITNQNIKERHISTLTTAVHRDDVTEYGKLIEKFKLDIDMLAMRKNRVNSPNSVYCLAMQFFNLTN